MRQKLALIIALAGFAVVTALGVGMAGADPSASLDDGQAAGGLTTTSTLPSSAQPPACANGVDDDRDGLTDLEDPDCESASDKTEEAEPETEAAAEPTAPATEEEPRAGGKVQSGASLTPPKPVKIPAPASCRTRASAAERKRRRRCTRARARPAGDQAPAEGADGGSQFTSGGAPTAANPTTTIAPFGPAPIGVPNFVIDSFEIPPFLLPIYQACGTEYGIPWEVLASINKIETAFGTNLNVSSAGAMGWMQFMPSSWEMYGRRRQRRRSQGPLQPGRRDLRRRPLPEGGRRPKRTSTARSSPTTTPTGTSRRCCSTRAPTASCRPSLVGSLTGLTEGAHFPVAADARYADDISARAALSRRRRRSARNTATPPK